MKVYLAGKISHNDWRRYHVDAIHTVQEMPDLGSNWPVLKNGTLPALTTRARFSSQQDLGIMGLIIVTGETLTAMGSGQRMQKTVAIGTTE